MLKENLLLDSARPFSDEHRNIVDGHPELALPGDLQSYSWYALRATYSRELKIKERLDSMGVKTFVPMMWRRKETAGKTQKRLVPAVGNLCFACWTRHDLDAFIRSYGENPPVNYYWDRIANAPLTVPEKAMEDFMKVSETMDEDLIYLTEISAKLREGQIVRITEGILSGVEGRVVRIRKSRRLLVEIPGMLAVASAYVPLDKAGHFEIVGQ